MSVLKRHCAQTLVSLLRTIPELTSRRSASTPAAKKKKPSTAKKPTSSLSSDDDIDLEQHLSDIFECPLKQFKAPSSSSSKISDSANTSLLRIVGIVSDRLSSAGCRGDDGIVQINTPIYKSAEQLSNDASGISQAEMSLEDSWLLDIPNGTVSVKRKPPHRIRKQKFVSTSSKGCLVNRCGLKLGSDATIELFGILLLGKETGLKEVNSLIRICIQKARDTTDEDVSVVQINMVYEVFKVLRERGFKIEEATYGQVLMYLIDCCMVQEFLSFADLIRNENPDLIPGLAYYENLLWIRVNNKEKNQELCRSNDAVGKSYF